MTQDLPEADREDDQPFYVLALSGGGFRGLYTATILKELEAAFGSPLARHFDLICGTSVGGLLALGLGAEIEAAKLCAKFEENGEKIFDSQNIGRKLVGRWTCARHDGNGLKETVNEILEDRLFGDMRHRILIPTVNFTTGLAATLKTPHHPRLERDWKWKAVDVALATTAAPTYFPLFQNEVGTFCDGGLVANAPGLLGLHEAKHLLGVKPNRVRVLSVGTLSCGFTMPGDGELDRGIAHWRSALFSLMISSQESLTNYMLDHELGDRYLQLDEEIGPDQSSDVRELDSVTTATRTTLKHRAQAIVQKCLPHPLIVGAKQHKAPPARFYHGPNKNTD